jgi:hypothetical protein
LGYSHDTDKTAYEVEAASEERQRWTPTTATGTKPTFTTPLFWPLPKVDHTDCNSEACGANIREEWYFRANAKLYARAVNSLVLGNNRMAA